MQPSVQKRRVKDVVSDIEAGMTDPYLMDKYDLGPDQLESLLRKIVSAGWITEDQLEQRLSLSDTAITKAFVEVQDSIQELDETDDTTTVGTVTTSLSQPSVIHEATAHPAGKVKRKIKAEVLASDIRAGMTDTELITKYGISPKQLQYLFGRLLDEGILTEMEFWERTTLTDSAVTNAFVEVHSSIKHFEDIEAAREGVDSSSGKDTDLDSAGRGVLKTIRSIIDR